MSKAFILHYGNVSFLFLYLQLLWERRLSEERASEIASIREEIFREFEEQKKAEIMETLEEAKEAWMEESEEQKREEVNEAMAYLESEYNKNLEEFKHKTLRDALEQARKQWTTEELSHREEILKVNVVSCVNHIKGKKLRARALRFLDYGENKIVLMKREVLFLSKYLFSSPNCSKLSEHAL